MLTGLAVLWASLPLGDEPDSEVQPGTCIAPVKHRVAIHLPDVHADLFEEFTP
jgi:hypothetical protein